MSMSVKGEFTCQIMSSLRTAGTSTPSLAEYALKQLLLALQPGKIRNCDLFPWSFPVISPLMLFEPILGPA